MAKYNFSVDGVSMEAVLNVLGGVEGACELIRRASARKEFEIVATAESGGLEYDFTVVTPGDLGFSRPASMGEFFKRAFQKGLALVPGSLVNDLGCWGEILPKEARECGINVAMFPSRLSIDPARGDRIYLILNGVIMSRLAERRTAWVANEKFLFIVPRPTFPLSRAS